MTFMTARTRRTRWQQPLTIDYVVKNTRKKVYHLDWCYFCNTEWRIASRLRGVTDFNRLQGYLFK